MYAKKHQEYIRPVLNREVEIKKVSHENKEVDPIFNWKSILIACSIMSIFVIGYITLDNYVDPNYEVTYIEYEMERGDNLESAIKEVNASYNKDYKIDALVGMAVKENYLDGPNHVNSGYTYKLPVLVQD